jgi:hypothetical protein
MIVGQEDADTDENGQLSKGEMKTRSGINEMVVVVF